MLRGVADEVGPVGLPVGGDLDPVAADAAPPVSEGALHDRSMEFSPSAVAVRPVGAPGGLARVVPLATSEAGPVPAELMAETR